MKSLATLLISVCQCKFVNYFYFNTHKSCIFYIDNSLLFIVSNGISRILFDLENSGSYDMKLKGLYTILQSDPSILNNKYKVLLLNSFGDALVNDER